MSEAVAVSGVLLVHLLEAVNLCLHLILLPETDTRRRSTFDDRRRTGIADDRRRTGITDSAQPQIGVNAQVYPLHGVSAAARKHLQTCTLFSGR